MHMVWLFASSTWVWKAAFMVEKPFFWTANGHGHVRDIYLRSGPSGTRHKSRSSWWGSVSPLKLLSSFNSSSQTSWRTIWDKLNPSAGSYCLPTKYDYSKIYFIMAHFQNFLCLKQFIISGFLETCHPLIRKAKCPRVDCIPPKEL